MYQICDFIMFLKSNIYMIIDVLVKQLIHSVSQLKALGLGICLNLP